MTTRTHQTLRCGLRRIIRDPQASIRTRKQAIRMLMSVEGLPTSAKNKPLAQAKSGVNHNRLKELAEELRKEKCEKVSPGALAS